MPILDADGSSSLSSGCPRCRLSRPLQCVGHQSGQEVEDLYLTYVDGDPAGPSAIRPMAQVGVVRLSD
ncbi:MAG: hypothetical protein OSA40_12685 [Phycisphaerales bacterium]|jgi:hypothetical protein|nr:hypothetical protein [Phycisphaerales bacterium]